MGIGPALDYFVRTFRVNMFSLIKNAIGVSLLVFLTSCATNDSNGPADENILIRLPIPDSGWTTHSGENGRESIKMWTKQNESFRVSIMHGRKPAKPEDFRTGMNNAARGQLASDFASTELKQGLVNNYPMEFWQTKITLKDGTRIVSLFLSIEGNDAAYLVQKRWTNTEVPDANLKEWTDYIQTISVCDNRYPEHKSPKMEEQWPGLYFRHDTTNSAAH